MDRPEPLARRDFFKKAGLTAGVAGVAAAGAVSEAKAATPSAKEKVGYRETEHVKTYYELARF